MEDEFIYWEHVTPVGIKVEEIFGTGDKSEKIWLVMARQIYCEHGGDVYREISHTVSGVPYLEDSKSRISISHTDHFLAVASLPRTPEADLLEFHPRTALGIDVERCDREQVLRVRDKFLSEAEKQKIDSENVLLNIIAWTSKEAMYKAGMMEGADFCNDCMIVDMPDIDGNGKGRGMIKRVDGQTYEMELYSYISEGVVVTLAYHPKCATFKKRQ